MLSERRNQANPLEDHRVGPERMFAMRAQSKQSASQESASKPL
jgi:hypothetical protein